MNVISIILLSLLGTLAASLYLQNQWPQLRPMLTKLNQYQAIIGIAGLAWGGLWLLILIIQVGYLFIATLFWIACIAVLGCLGILMGQQYIIRWLPSDQQKQTLQHWQQELSPYQTKLGLAALVLAALQLLWLVF
jgi:hypothetical protein